MNEKGEPLAICMEYVVGRSLKKTIELGKLTESETRNYAQQIASGLQYIHSKGEPSKGIIHRDLKSNREDEIVSNGW